MVLCPECGQEMATVLRYSRDQQRTYYSYECTACQERARKAQEKKRNEQTDE